MKPLYTTQVAKTDLKGDVESAHPNLIETTETVRWRPPGVDAVTDAYSGYVYLDPDKNLKVVVDSRNWDVYLVDSVIQINDENRTAVEQAAEDKRRADAKGKE